jgi:hypothetical protein
MSDNSVWDLPFNTIPYTIIVVIFFTHIWKPFSWTCFLIFLISIVGGGVQLGPLGTAVTDRPIVPALGDYGNGEVGGMIGREN